jgi:hypothetical protein
MRRLILTAATTVGLLGCGAVTSTTVAISAAGAAEHATRTVVHVRKSAFCGANISIDRASANVTSLAGFLAVLKTHSHDLAILKKDAPSGAVGQLAIKVVNGAEAAVSANNANALDNLPDGSSLDTYCGVDGSGSPLPAYFGTGTSTAFCTNFVPIFEGVSNAQNAAGVLSVLMSHASQITQLSSELSTLPKSIKTKATTTVDSAQTAITTNSAAAIKGNGNGAAMDVALYCGQNG